MWVIPSVFACVCAHNIERSRCIEVAATAAEVEEEKNMARHSINICNKFPKEWERELSFYLGFACTTSDIK